MEELQAKVKNLSICWKLFILNIENLKCVIKVSSLCSTILYEQISINANGFQFCFLLLIYFRHIYFIRAYSNDLFSLSLRWRSTVKSNALCSVYSNYKFSWNVIMNNTLYVTQAFVTKNKMHSFICWNDLGAIYIFL